MTTFNASQLGKLAGVSRQRIGTLTKKGKLVRDAILKTYNPFDPVNANWLEERGIVIGNATKKTVNPPKEPQPMPDDIEVGPGQFIDCYYKDLEGWTPFKSMTFSEDMNQMGEIIYPISDVIEFRHGTGESWFDDAVVITSDGVEHPVRFLIRENKKVEIDLDELVSQIDFC